MVRADFRLIYLIYNSMNCPTTLTFFDLNYQCLIFFFWGKSLGLLFSKHFCFVFSLIFRRPEGSGPNSGAREVFKSYSHQLPVPTKHFHIPIVMVSHAYYRYYRYGQYQRCLEVLFKSETSTVTLCHVTNSDQQAATCKLLPPSE